MTQSTVAAGDISVAYLSRIEAGQRRPDLRVLSRLCERLGVSIDEVLTGVQAEDADRLQLTLQFAEMALRSGDAVDAATHARDVVAELKAHSHDRVLRRAQWLLARALESQGRLQEALELLEKLRRESGGEPEPDVAIVMCRCYREAGDLNRSIDIGERALRRIADAGVPGGDEEIRLAVTLAAAYFERGDVAYAASLCMQSVERAEEMGTSASRAAAYWNASVMQSRNGDVALAVRLAERALALMSEGDDVRNLARLRAQLGFMLLRQSPPDVDAAEVALLRAREELLDSDGSAVDIAHCDLQLARARLIAGDIDAAERQALQVCEAVPHAALTVADAQAVLGRAAMARGATAEAVAMFRRAVLTLTAVQADRNAAQLWYELGEMLDRVGDTEAARDAYRSAAAAVGLRTTVQSSLAVESGPG